MIGTLSNGLANCLNDGHMPVLDYWWGDINGHHHVWATDAHRALWLADRFSGMSIGDIALGLGVIVILAARLNDERIARLKT